MLVVAIAAHAVKMLLVQRKRLLTADAVRVLQFIETGRALVMLNQEGMLTTLRASVDHGFAAARQVVKRGREAFRNSRSNHRRVR
ncbi:hypothetical protein D3C78_1843550 [compost metagenome]